MPFPLCLAMPLLVCFHQRGGAKFPTAARSLIFGVEEENIGGECPPSTAAADPPSVCRVRPAAVEALTATAFGGHALAATAHAFLRTTVHTLCGKFSQMKMNGTAVTRVFNFLEYFNFKIFFQLFQNAAELRRETGNACQHLFFIYFICLNFAQLADGEWHQP